MPSSLPSYVLTRDTTCREGCPHYGYAAVLHSHYEQAEQPDPGPSRFWRVLFRIWGNGGR